MFKKYFESTTSADIAQAPTKLKPLKKLKKLDSEEVEENFKESKRDEAEKVLNYISSNCKSKRMKAAIDEVLDLMDGC